MLRRPSMTVRSMRPVSRIGYTATLRWCACSMKRLGLALRRKTTIKTSTGGSKRPERASCTNWRRFLAGPVRVDASNRAIKRSGFETLEATEMLAPFGSATPEPAPGKRSQGGSADLQFAGGGEAEEPEHKREDRHRQGSHADLLRKRTRW